MIGVFRLEEHRPERNDYPNKVSRYQQHKSSLIIDFKERCGYCNSHHIWRDAFYEIDHFVPYDFFKDFNVFTKEDYSNLVYSCRYCNNSKRSKWPSQDHFVHNDGNEGFVDPCESTYEDHFTRDKKGRIIPETPLGQWMYRTFKFDIREKQLQLIWNLEVLLKTYNELEEIRNQCVEGTNEYNQCEDQMNKCSRLYIDYDRELKGFY